MPNSRSRAAVAVLLAAAAVLTVLTVEQQTQASGDDKAVVRTDHGPVRGSTDDRTRTFQGIPYARPPVGELRWRDPLPARKWTAVRDAREPGPACAQLEGTELSPRSSEDCLYLNVTTPRRVGTHRPVIVYLHGGAFSSGAGSDFDARRTAATGDAVVVTVNSRLGVLGFFGHPGLPGSGTYGLTDQQAALRWVRANAEAFGGDPGNVTLMGESSGGASVCAQLTSPRARGLFHRAVVHSGSCLQNWRPNVMTPDSEALSYWAPREEVQRAGKSLAGKLCGSRRHLDCLRNTEPSELLAYNGKFLRPAHHTRTLPLDPVRALETGAFARVPVLQGNTRDEHRTFGVLSEQEEPMTEPQYRANLVKSFGADRAARILARYPVGRGGRYAPGLAWASVGTDSSWVCPTVQADRLLSAHVPVWSFEFADPYVPDIIGVFPKGYPRGAYHGSELPMLFDLDTSYDGLGPAQRKLSEVMIAHWTRFARTGDPDITGRPSWRRFDPDGGATTQVFDTRLPGGVGRTDVADRHNCAFWADELDEN